MPSRDARICHSTGTFVSPCPLYPLPCAGLGTTTSRRNTELYRTRCTRTGNRRSSLGLREGHTTRWKPYAGGTPAWDTGDWRGSSLPPPPIQQHTMRQCRMADGTRTPYGMMYDLTQTARGRKKNQKPNQTKSASPACQPGLVRRFGASPPNPISTPSRGRARSVRGPRRRRRQWLARGSASLARPPAAGGTRSCGGPQHRLAAGERKNGGFLQANLAAQTFSDPPGSNRS